MGILGLTTFVDENPHLLTDHKLCNTKIVIDGNNLYHFLYYYFNINPQFGGDYDLFAEGVRSYFKKLKYCNIDAHVVFDGAYHSDDRKLKTSLKRATDRIRLARLIASGDRAKILPILVYETFRSVLDELSVKHVTCDFEADNQLTALANALNCPVMSNDSDFFVFDVKCGFILIDYTDLHLHVETDEAGNITNFLKVQIFYLDTLLGFFPGFNKEVIPLFATILGNDYIAREEFDDFFAKANLPKGTLKQFFSIAKRHSKFLSLLLWLQSEETLEDAVQYTLKFIHKDRREHVEELLRKSINEYQNPQTILLSHFVHDASVSECQSLIKTTSGNLLPSWFVTQIRVGLIPAMCLNVIVSNRVILLSQVECMDYLSAYSCSQKLRNIIYGLLQTIGLRDRNGILKSAQDVVEYSRLQNNLKKNAVTPKFELNSSDNVPFLEEISLLPTEVRLDYMLKFLSIGHESYLQLQQSVDEGVLLPLLSVNFWIENANPSLTDVHMKALILCFLYLWMVQNGDDTELKDTETDDSCISVLGHDMLLKDVKTACTSLKKFTSPAKLSKIDSSIIHCFAQYQTCLQGSIYLNQLLLCPFPSPNPAKLISGTFLYNLFRELSNRKCPELYIEEMLGRTSTVLTYFQNVVKMVVQNVSSGEKLLPCAPGSKNSKKKMKKEKRKSKSNVSSVNNEVDMDQMEDTEVLSNKFSALLADPV